MDREIIIKILTQKAEQKIKELDQDLKIKGRQIVSAFKAGMDNAIYNHPAGKFYRRTGNLKKAVRFKKSIERASGEVSVNLKVFVNEDILSRLPNKKGQGGNYNPYVIFSPTNTVGKVGYMPFAKQQVNDFILTDMIKQGIFS